MKAFTILIVAAALVAVTFCSDANYGQKLAGALGLKPGITLDQCKYDMEDCKKVVRDVQTLVATHLNEEKEFLYKKCAGLPNLFELKTNCKDLADKLHSMSETRLSHWFDTEVICAKSKIESCKP